jgi:uncharacterized protein YerC
MRRYRKISKESVYDALNKLRNAFLAAKNGEDVEEIIRGILTHDERMKIGRRIQIANLLQEGKTHDEILEELKVGRSTICAVEKFMDNYPNCFALINMRERKVDSEFNKKAFENSGNPKHVFRSLVYTGYKRKDVKR